MQTVDNVTIQKLSVDVRVIRVGGHKMTLAVFEQLPSKDLFEVAGNIWGWVRRKVDTFIVAEDPRHALVRARVPWRDINEDVCAGWWFFHEPAEDTNVCSCGEHRYYGPDRCSLRGFHRCRTPSVDDVNLACYSYGNGDFLCDNPNEFKERIADKLCRARELGQLFIAT